MADSPSSPAMVTSQSSDLAGDLVAPINSLRSQTTLNQENLARESMSMEWTDEKHNLYLKSMEASFVNDLYNSFNLLSYRVEHSSDPNFSRRKHTSSRAPSGQFKVLQGGCWEKINFERTKSRSEKVDGPDVLLSNPWIRHFRSSCERQTVASSTREKDALAADMSSYDSDEVTDQNFVDEEDKREEASQTYYPKRIKTSFAPSTSNDQVVP